MSLYKLQELISGNEIVVYNKMYKIDILLLSK